MIDEFRDLTPADMATLTVSPVGIHVESADVDVNSAGLIWWLCDLLKAEAAKSF